jgi:hypothetical protein
MSERVLFEPLELFQRLVARDVRFVVVGGIAAEAHGVPLATYDLDIVPLWNRENLARIAEVLTDIAAIREGVPADAPPMPPLDTRTLLAGAVFTLNSRFGRFDLLANPDPGYDYEHLMRAAETFDYHGLRLSVAALDDLIAMKRAAGRPKDLVALEHLGALREEIDRSPPSGDGGREPR